MRIYKKNSIKSNIETAFVRHIAYLNDCKDMGEYSLLKPSGDNIIRQSLKVKGCFSMDTIWSDMLHCRRVATHNIKQFELETIKDLQKETI